MIRPRDKPTAAEIVAHEAKPVPYQLGVRRVDHLVFGFKGRSIDFSWRPYAKRTAAARADYDRLRASIEEHGIQAPVIIYGHSVLIGMRRVEIAQELGITHVKVAEIHEDVSLWWKHDIPRLEALKVTLGLVRY